MCMYVRGSHKYQKYGQKRRLLRQRQIIFWLFRKTIFPRNSVPFHFELRNGHFRGIRNSVGISTFFCGITESIPRVFRGIFSEQNSIANPSWAANRWTCVRSLAQHLKGTVPRDFWLLVFYMDQFPPSLWLYHKGRLKFFRKFRRYSQLKVHYRCQRHWWQMEKFSLFLLDTFG